MCIDTNAIKIAINIIDFKKTELLKIALTHPSYIYERNEQTKQQKDEQERNYRRLAHLGDAIVGAIVTDYLYNYYSDSAQDKLTNLKHKIVNRENLSKFAQQLNLKHFCLLGNGEKDKKEDEQKRLFSEMFEALLGAIYLEFEPDFSKTRCWFIVNCIKEL